MAAPDFPAIRLFADAPLAAGQDVALGPDATNYLVNVLRLKSGDAVLVFNGRDGEWRARLRSVGKKAAVLAVEAATRTQTPAGDLWYLFAPLKHARLDYVVQKAVEMGASVLQPVLTRHTQVSRINLDRMRANVVEAAEQCGVLAVPKARAETTLPALLADWPATRTLIFCDEDAELADPVATLGRLRNRSLAVLIGPEGGFAVEEREQLLAVPGIVRLSLGPRILRAETAAIAGLTLWQANLGDWA